MKKTSITTTLFLAVTVVFSCGKDKIIPDAYPEYSIVEGDTVKTRIDVDNKKLSALDISNPKLNVVGDTIVTYKSVKLHTPPQKLPDLNNIKNNDNPALAGKPLRYIAVGGSLTAGVRDGGYFNEGIQTSYPNLVARQMGIQKFEQPLFEVSDYNGYARKALSGQNFTGGPVPKYKEAKNNSGVSSITKVDFKLKKYSGKVDNFGTINLFAPAAFLNAIKHRNGNSVYKEFLSRFIKDENLSLSDQILVEDFDLISFETGWHETWDFYVNKSSGTSSVSIYTDGINNLNSSNVYPPASAGLIHGKMTFFKKLHESKKAKYGYLMNLPMMTDLPYFNIVTRDDVNRMLGMVDKNMMIRENVKVLPTSEIDSLLGVKVNMASKKGLSLGKPLSKYSFLTEDEQKGIAYSIERFNEETKSLSKSFNFPIVDLRSLYSEILKGSFTTDDGVRVDGSFPKGNFFSSDAIYPSAFGQAVIANEVIKTLNKYYKMSIPLTNTREYLR